MAIQNGKERIENLRKAMHREIDKTVDDVILGQSTKGFTITFDCGIDRILFMKLSTDTVIRDNEGNFVHYTEADIEPLDIENDSEDN